MQKVRFLPRAVVEHYIPEKYSVLISFIDEKEYQLELEKGWQDILRLHVHDIDKKTEGLTLFDEQHAQEILDFISKHRGHISELVVNCTMGQSRSAAVALYIAERYGVKCFKENIEVNWATWCVYNKWIYRVMLQADTGNGHVASAAYYEKLFHSKN